MSTALADHRANQWRTPALTMLVILVSKSLYFESYGENSLLIPLFLIVLFSFPLTLRYQVNQVLILWAVAFCFLTIANANSQTSSLLVLINRIAIALWLVMMIPFPTFARSFERIILFISACSLLSLPIIAFNIHSPLPSFIAIDQRPLRNFFLFGVSESFVNYSVFRNSGPWWEPGAFQVFVNISALFSILLARMTTKKYLLYLVVIASTQSTTGILVFFLLSILHFSTLSNHRNNTMSKVLFLFLTPASVMLALPLIMDKFNLESSSVVSFLSRLYDVQVSYNLFMEHPWFGYGFGSQIQIAIPYAQQLLGEFICSSSAKPTGADGITMLIAQCGIFSFLFLLPFLWPKYLRHFSYPQRLIAAISLFLLFNTENLSFTLIFIVLIFYGILRHPDISAMTEKP